MPSILNHAVELRHLLYFQALAQHGSFTRAAAVIGLRQPTLSQQIHQMEKALGVPLFDRARRRCRLTSAGEMLLPYVRRVLAEMENLRSSLDDLSDLKRGSLTVAVLPSVTHQLLPLALEKFHEDYSGIQVRILEMSVDEMERALVMGTVELGIGHTPPAETSLRHQSLYAEELVAVVATSDRLARRESATMEEISTRPLLVPPPGYGTRTLLLKAFAKVRRTPNFALELSSVDMLLHMVAAGSGLGIVPSSALWGRVAKDYAVVRIIRPTPKRQIGFLTLHGVHTRPAAEAFIPIVRAVAKNLGE
ncbi:LysR substrate-binding domain-containing protein [Rariglobus hedericola]|uniref:LysR family transcriptional regulator n=1 Tax=Rariglobus hedericola TaxID=2597822 RepID=A0A556QGJ8_9BACT|nr:LysR substrate-binding domain-containing protein [Rariglobus hedericola]TSJ75741.1 LysR family transcriptional regulator [Rariglobus hedericola]